MKVETLAEKVPLPRVGETSPLQENMGEVVPLQEKPPTGGVSYRVWPSGALQDIVFYMDEKRAKGPEKATTIVSPDANSSTIEEFIGSAQAQGWSYGSLQDIISFITTERDKVASKDKPERTRKKTKKKRRYPSPYKSFGIQPPTKR